jgi:hypothetical protein
MIKLAKKSKISIILISFICATLIAIAAGFVFNTVSAYNVLSWDLVDGGKHMDWKGSSKYLDEWNTSVGVWEDYKSGVIRKDTFWTINDVTISDYSEETTVMAYTSSSGKMCFNDYHFETMSSGQRQKTIMHEIGHALGLDHNNSDITSIMCQGKRSQTTLNDDDKAGYDYLYDNVY